jgi:hypothetical protein
MREPKLCPRCGYSKFGICSPCFPEAAAREKAEELAEILHAEEQQRRRKAGMIHCPEHDEYDGCWEFRRYDPAGDQPLTWQAAMDQLWARYVGP